MSRSRILANVLPMSALIVASALLLSPRSAAAGESVIPRTTVRYSDLNLQSAAGVQTLYARLRSAARAVCAAQDDGTLQGQLEFRSCVSQSLERAVRDVRNEAVLALYRQDIGAARRS